MGDEGKPRRVDGGGGGGWFVPIAVVQRLSTPLLLGFFVGA